MKLPEYTTDIVMIAAAVKNSDKDKDSSVGAIEVIITNPTEDLDKKLEVDHKDKNMEEITTKVNDQITENNNV